MIEKIADLVRDKKIEGISHVQDESDRIGVRVVIELKRDATAEVVLNQLFRFTPMQTSFGCNMLALNGGRPEQLTLRDFLSHFISFREEVVARRTAFDLRKARERSHVLCGLAVAVSNVDEVVATIRASADAAEAREKLMTRRWPARDIIEYIRLIDDPTHTVNDDGTYNLSETQARAILDLRLQRLTATRRQGSHGRTCRTWPPRSRITSISCGSRERIMAIISDELREVKEQFAVPRRTEIVDWSGDMDDEDLIEREDMVVTITQCRLYQAHAAGRFPRAAARRQGPVGHGHQGRGCRHHAFRRQHPYAASVLHHRRHGLQAEDLASAAGRAHRQGQGDRQHPADSHRASRSPPIMPVDAPEEDWENLQIFFATSDGDVRRNALSDFTNVKSQRQDRDETARGRAAGECADLHRRRRRDAGHGAWPRDPLPHDRCAGLQGPQFDRRARHPAGQGR